MRDVEREACGCQRHRKDRQEPGDPERKVSAEVAGLQDYGSNKLHGSLDDAEECRVCLPPCVRPAVDAVEGAVEDRVAQAQGERQRGGETIEEDEARRDGAGAVRDDAEVLRDVCDKDEDTEEPAARG